MKRSLLFILLMVIFLSACNMKEVQSSIESTHEPIQTHIKSSTTTTVQSETIISDETTSEIPVISYEDIKNEIESYFIFFFNNNHNFSCNFVNAETERSTNGTYVVGYFYNDSIVSMISEQYGEGQSSFITYYFVNSNLTYIIERTNYQWPLPRKESYQEYFLIDQKLWQYNNETSNLIESNNSGVLDYFEQDKYALIGDKDIIFEQNDHTLSEANNYLQFNEMRKVYFEKFFSGEKFEICGDYFQVDMPNFYNYYYSRYFQSQSDINAVFADSQLYLLRMAIFDEESYTGYEYFILDDSNIYVVKYKQEFENKEVDFNKLKENYYEEYLIIDEKTMKYDSDKQDLIEVSDETEILTNFNIAKNSIVNSKGM